MDEPHAALRIRSGQVLRSRAWWSNGEGSPDAPQRSGHLTCPAFAVAALGSMTPRAEVACFIGHADAGVDVPDMSSGSSLDPGHHHKRFGSRRGHDGGAPRAHRRHLDTTCVSHGRGGMNVCPSSVAEDEAAWTGTGSSTFASGFSRTNFRPTWTPKVEHANGSRRRNLCGRGGSRCGVPSGMTGALVRTVRPPAPVATRSRPATPLIGRGKFVTRMRQIARPPHQWSRIL